MPGTSAPARRSDAGQVRLTGRDISGLLLAGEMHAVPYDLLGAALAARPDRDRPRPRRARPPVRDGSYAATDIRSRRDRLRIGLPGVSDGARHDAPG